MAKLVWTEPALADLDEIADYIVLDDEQAAERLVAKVFRHVEQLIAHPESGSVPAELRLIKIYRQIVEPPRRVFHPTSGQKIYIVHVLRGEQLIKKRRLTRKPKT